ncbi:MAG: GtrA family protein [bacterium]
MRKIVKTVFEREIIRYGFVGLISTILDFAFLNITYILLGNIDNHLWLATASGFLIGTINGYIMNSRWTFQYETKGTEAKKFTKFAIIGLVGFALTELIVLGLAHLLDVDKNIAKLIAVVIVFFWNYFANKHWTFKKHT